MSTFDKMSWIHQCETKVSGWNYMYISYTSTHICTYTYVYIWTYANHKATYLRVSSHTFIYVSFCVHTCTHTNGNRPTAPKRLRKRAKSVRRSRCGPFSCRGWSSRDRKAAGTPAVQGISTRLAPRLSRLLYISYQLFYNSFWQRFRQFFPWF